MFESFPKKRLAFEAAFTREEDCLDYLAKLRWPGGFSCPKCGHDKHWAGSRHRYICAACRHQASVTAGTIFHRTRSPLALWFRAIWYMTVQKHGGSSLGLQREVGLGSYHTAWEWFHKLRRAMVRPGREQLGGLVEVDETYLGAPKSGKSGRGAAGKALIAVAVEDKGFEGFGRIRMQRIPDASGQSLAGFATGHIAPGSEIRTDAWKGYNPLVRHGYTHLVVNATKQKEAGEDALPLCHRVISLFKRSWVGMFQGSIHYDHLDRYLEEYTFRFNRRKSKHRTLLVFRLLQNAVICPPLPAKEIELGLGRQSRHKPRLTSGLRVATRRAPVPIPAAALPPLATQPDLPF